MSLIACKPRLSVAKSDAASSSPSARIVPPDSVTDPVVEAVEMAEPAPTQWEMMAEPDTTSLEGMNLWATYYHIHSAEDKPGGIPVLGYEGQSLGFALSEHDWCEAALEGTVAIRDSAGVLRIFNYADHKGPAQVNCGKYYRSLSGNVINGMSKTRFTLAEAPFGYGVRGWWLAPYRTIAVDPNTIPYGSVLYIPAARGRELLLPDGSRVVHDGYFFAGDTGGAIRQNHIDVFGGFLEENPFPAFIFSQASRTFRAFLVESSRATELMEEWHEVR